MNDKLKKSKQQWQESLTPEQFRVCREKGTERAFSGKYYDCKDRGVYRCVCCGNELFRSEEKFDSGTGWPSFTGPQGSGRVDTEIDSSLAMQRTEVLCGRCNAHLGHVFDDGPGPTHKRYCINSVALDLDQDNNKK